MPIKDDGVLDMMFQGTIAFFYFTKEVSRDEDGVQRLESGKSGEWSKPEFRLVSAVLWVSVPNGTAGAGGKRPEYERDTQRPSEWGTATGLVQIRRKYYVFDYGILRFWDGL